MRETPRARVAFADYVALGDGRSLERLVDRYRSAPEVSPTTRLATLKRWSASHNWQARITEIAAQQEQEAAEHWVQVRAEHRNRMLMTGQALLARADEMLKWPLARRTVQGGEDGEQTVVLEPARWSFGDAGRMVEIADRLVRLAAEMDTDRRRVTIDDDVRKLAVHLGVDPVDFALLADAFGRGERAEDIANLAERIANGHDGDPQCL